MGKHSFPILEHDMQVDVVIVGGGITGLTAAYLLKKSGKRVAVLEKNTIASGTTSGTTGKVTAQHGLIYSQLVQKKGEKAAALYGAANQAALEKIASVIKTEKIVCSWHRADNYVFTTNPKEAIKYENEAKTAAKLGLPASYETRLGLPFKVVAAVKFADQAYFHAPNYALGLAAAITGNGSYVFEHTNVVHFNDGEPAKVRTHTASVTAKDVIVATKVPAAPLLARFSYAALEYPHTSYIVAGPLKQNVEGMYISKDNNHYSILPLELANEKLLLIGGRKHIPGLGNSRKRHQQLADYAEKHFGLQSITHRWKAMDYLAYDNVPLIGKLYPWSKHMYVATGFQKWGLTTSMVAAEILRDAILGQKNQWADVFKTTRLQPVWSLPRAVGQYLASTLPFKQ
jgi:glycine/D-amino acid oxidase-like deaminating enzyme